MTPQETGKNFNRRDFLKSTLALIGGGAVLYTAWRLNYNSFLAEEARNFSEWEPKVANLLTDSLHSTNPENLHIFNEADQQRVIDLIRTNQSSLYSENQALRDEAQYKVMALILGLHYQAVLPEKSNQVPEADTAMKFLNDTLALVDPSTIQQQSTEHQTNMWIEAVYRSWAAAWEIDPTQKDGVYLPDQGQSLFGMAIAPRHSFIRLQTHS